MADAGKFIALEGIDGSGTTTQVKLLHKALKGQGREVVLTAEPSGGPIGVVIREILRGNAETPPEALALLFAADRVDHWNNSIRPALERGNWVITDRYLLSSIVYQSLDCDAEWVRDINSRVGVPDLNILLDLPVDKALSRLERRGESPELFEKKDKLEKIRNLYLEAAKGSGGGPVKIIDASSSIEEIHRDILNLSEKKA